MAEKLADASDSAVSSSHTASAERTNATQATVAAAPSLDRITAASSPLPAMSDSARAATMTGAQATVGTARLNRLMNPPLGRDRRSASLQPAETLPVGAAEAARAPTGGQPLETSVRGPVERAVGADLSGVRVHTGPEANAAAESLSARAFTTGNDIFLGPGESPENTRLIAHEAAHVVHGQVDPKIRRYTPSGGDEHEGQARRAEDAAVSAMGSKVGQQSTMLAENAADMQSASPSAASATPDALTPPPLEGSPKRGSVDIRATAGVADDSIGPGSRPDGTRLVLRRLAESAAAGRQDFAARLIAAVDGIETRVEGYEIAVARAGEQQRQAVTAAFNAGRHRIATRFASARANVARGGQAQHAALGVWQTRTIADVGRLFGAKQARVIQIGEDVAGRATTAGERAAADARARIRNKAQEARQIGAAKAHVVAADPDVAKAKAKVALDLAADTASNVLKGVEDVGSGLTASGPDVAARFREQAARASLQLRLAEPQVIGQVGRIRADAAAAVTHTVSMALASLAAQERHLTAQMTRQEARAHATLRSAVASKRSELRQAGEQARETLVQQGMRVLVSARAGTRELASQVAAQPIAPDEAAAAAGQVAGGMRSAFGDVGEKADAAVVKVQVGLDAGASEAVSAITRVGSAVDGDVTGNVAQITGNVREHETASISALTHISETSAKAGTGLLSQVGAGLDQNVGELDGGFNKGLADYERSLRDKVSEKESKAVEPVSTLGARIDTAQARVEDEAGHSWIGNQLRSLGRMLTDPGFWAGLVVGLLLTILVIVLLPEELTALVVVAAIAAFAAVGAIAAGVGTIVDNLIAGRSWHEGLGRAMLIGAVFGAVLGGVALALGASAATLAGAVTLSAVAGVLTVITNLATGRPWDENLLANMLLVGLFARFGGRLIEGLRGARGPVDPPPPVVDPNRPPVVDPNRPPVVDPNRPPVVDPNAPPVVDPNRPPAVDPNRPPAVDPNQPPPAYDPTTRTIDELRGDLDPTPRPAETPEQAAERVRRAQIELDHRQVLDRLNALPERPPQVDMAANDAANRPNGAHTTTRHSPDFPMERRVDAGGHPDGTQTVEGRLYEDPPWDTEGGQANKSFHWRSWDLLNEAVNRYLRRNCQQIREDLALLEGHDATVDAGKPIGDGYFNRRAGQPGARQNPLPQRINNVSRFTIRIRFNPGGNPPFFILTTFPDPPLFI